jgi:hypothetical protein
MIDRIDDEPVRFFLRHRAQIEAWAGLVSEAKQYAHQAMTTVGDRLAENPPNDAEIFAAAEGSHDTRLLYRPDWLGEDARPTAAVGIGWYPTRVDFKPASCWIGIWRGQRDAPDPLVDLLRLSLTEIAAELELKKSDDPRWPLYRWEANGPSGEFWDDLRPWIKELEEAVRTVWAHTADEIEQILHGRGSTAP